VGKGCQFYIEVFGGRATPKTHKTLKPQQPKTQDPGMFSQKPRKCIEEFYAGKSSPNKVFKLDLHDMAEYFWKNFEGCKDALLLSRSHPSPTELVITPN